MKTGKSHTSLLQQNFIFPQFWRFYKDKRAIGVVRLPTTVNSGFRVQRIIVSEKGVEKSEDFFFEAQGTLF